MKLKLQLNIGTIDANRLGLDKTKQGEIVDPKKDVATELLKRGWAVEVGSDKPAALK